MLIAGFAPYIAYKAISFMGFDMYHAMSTEQEAKSALNRPMPIPNGRGRTQPSKVLDGLAGGSGGKGGGTSGRGASTPGVAAPSSSSGGAGSGGAGVGAAAAAGGAAAAAMVARKAAAAGPKVGGYVAGAAAAQSDGASGSPEGSRSAPEMPLPKSSDPTLTGTGSRER
ncbi:hypothetical protein [Nocardioides sambongensis]|uniref:hypothetical protein n=1 Tax=Nocardioides sambongensis TaxID=2589074 RepID=UPI001E3E3F8B|nr:hypothetical protein [Nocardioides sambongensis]